MEETGTCPLLQILDGNGRVLGGGHKSLIGQASHAHESLLGLDLSVPRRHPAEKVLKGLWRENVLAQDWVLSLGGTHGCKQLVGHGVDSDLSEGCNIGWGNTMPGSGGAELAEPRGWQLDGIQAAGMLLPRMLGGIGNG